MCCSERQKILNSDDSDHVIQSIYVTPTKVKKELHP
jgi:hypothetical protein